MSATDAPWALPGPARAVATLTDELYRTRAVLVRAPVAADGLRRAVERRLHEDGQVRVLSIAPTVGEPALPQIAAAAGARSDSAAGLVTDPALADRALLIGGIAASDPALHDLMRLAVRGAGPAAPLVMVVGDGRLPGCSGVRAHDMRATLSPLDAAAHLAAAPPAWSGFEQRLGVAVVSEVAGWDMGLLARLAALRIGEAVRPDRCVAAWGDERSARWVGRPPSWADGSLDDWGGEEFPHPLWLAANQPDRLAKRVWRGQVSVMLPFVETRRLELIARFRAMLRPDLERCGPGIESLDWGPLRVQLAGRPRWLVETIDAFRDARNHLAHGRPLEWAQIATCLTAARRWSSGAR